MTVQPANVRTKSVYESAKPSDGRRVLATRYWPRGVPRAAVDEYVRALAPSRELLKAYKAGQLQWQSFRQQYLQEVRAPEARGEVQRLAEQASRQTITLMCVCRDEQHCHRWVLRNLILNLAIGRRGDGSGRYQLDLL